jgi:hypothetical protein
MAQKNQKLTGKENFLLMPNHVLNNSELGKGEQELYSHIYSFGRKGCWQNNETLAKMFHRRPRTITLWVMNLKKSGLIFWLHPKGYYRTFWAKLHPDVIAAQSLPYRDGEISKAAVISGQTKSTLLSKKLPSNIAKNCAVSAQENVIPLSKKLLQTNNTTKKDTIRDTTATPTPLPAGGQASALLADRQREQQETVERSMRGLGRPVNKIVGQLTPAQFEESRRKKLAALRGSE